MSVSPTYIYLTDSTGQLWSFNINTDGSLSTVQSAGPSPSPAPSSFATTTAGDIIDSVLQDAQLLSTNRLAALDYVNRVQMRILRETQWIFLRSQPQLFITQPGSTDYYIGSSDTIPSGCIPTGLDLSDVWSVWIEGVFDLSNKAKLSPDSYASLNSNSLAFKDGQWRPGRPRSFKYDITRPNVLSIYPAADNQNSYQPVPKSPISSAVAAAASLTDRTYYVFATFVDDMGNESCGSTVPTVVYVPAASTLVAKPPLSEVASAAQVTYSKWNCYVGTSATTAVLQNNSPLAITASYDETTSGQVTGTASLPTVNALTPLNGYVIAFQYYTTRPVVSSLADVLIIPDYYSDVVTAGVNYFFCLYMDKDSDRNKAGVWKQEFLDGIRQIRKDLNISFRNTDFLSPDTVSQANQTNVLGYYGFI